MEAKGTTWTDAYGIWWAAVPMTGDDHADACRARRLIRDQLTARGDIGPGYRLKIRRESVTTHGTARYVEDTTFTRTNYGTI